MKNLFLPPIVFLLCIAIMVLLDRFASIVTLIDAPWSWFGLPLMIIGLGIANWHARLFKRIGTNIKTFDMPDVFVRNGLFQYTRNPMYLGFTIAITGVAVLLGSICAFAVVILWILITRQCYIPAEEKMMLEKFGGEYLEYKDAVRRWL